MRSVLAFLCFVALSNAASIQFRDCGSKGSKITEVDLSPCNNPSLCEVKQGSDIQFGVKFDSSVSSKGLYAKVFGHLPTHQVVPFPLPNPDGCQSGIECPISPGGSYHYQNALSLDKSLPLIKVIVEYQLVDDNGDKVWCFEAPLQVVQG